jgi:hypothetical protein
MQGNVAPGALRAAQTPTEWERPQADYNVAGLCAVNIFTVLTRLGQSFVAFCPLRVLTSVGLATLLPLAAKTRLIETFTPEPPGTVPDGGLLHRPWRHLTRRLGLKQA